MFDVGRFVDDCRKSNDENEAHKAVREVVARVVAEPLELLRGLGESTSAMR